MSDAFPEEVLEERSLEEREHAEHPLPDDVDEADALDQYRVMTGEVDRVEPRIPDDVDEADAIDQHRPVTFDDEDEWREG
jgi:hypothetical protein